jgi:plasmid stabilization system protein ParE
VAASKAPVAFSSAARADLRQAISWYEEQAGLGDVLAVAIHKATDVIAAAPERWPVRRGKHRYVMRRYPYTIAYLTDGKAVTIVAVAHHSRDPASWQDRR